MFDPVHTRLLLLDSCAIVNLYASAQFESIIECLEGDIGIADYVFRESQFVRNSLENDSEEKEPIWLNDVIDSGRLQILELHAEEEFELFLSLALRLDEGEAATLALAAIRHGVLVTDDRKALSIAHEFSVSTLTSPEVLHHWATTTTFPERTVCEALRNIRFRARYEPGKNHPLSLWWRSVIDSGELS